MPLLNTGRMFQTLLTEIVTPLGGYVSGELYPESIDRLPFVVHRSWGQRDSNNDLLWYVTLSLTVYSPDDVSFDVNDALDTGMRGWTTPGSRTGVVPNLGAITSLDQEFQALAAMTAAEDASMTNKLVHQSQGSWQYVVRQHI